MVADEIECLNPFQVNEDGEKGVYCLIDSQVKFKPVDTIFEKDGYLYYSKSIEGSLAKLNLETLEEKTLLDEEN